MTDRNELYEGLSNVAWGYFLLFVNFNLNINAISINILPQFAGCLLLLSAIRRLTPERRDLALLRPLCLLLTVWHSVSWAFALAGIRLEDVRLVFLDLLVVAATLYFHFQFLTDIAALAEKYQSEKEHRDILRCRTYLILLLTASNVAVYLPLVFTADWAAAVVTMLAVCLLAAMLIVVLLLMMALFRLRRHVREGGEEAPGADL